MYRYVVLKVARLPIASPQMLDMFSVAVELTFSDLISIYRGV